MPEALAGLRLLQTRPAGSGESLWRILRSEGAEVTALPLLAIQPLAAEADAELLQANRQRLLKLDSYDKLIFISVNAVQAGMAAIADYWPQCPVGLEWLAIGAATRKALDAEGIPSEAAAGMNSEALLSLPAMQSVAGQRILILRGVGGRETLAETLRERGAQVDYLECYRRVASPVTAEELHHCVQERCINTVLLSSGESLQRLQSLLAGIRPAPALTLVVPGARVAELARKLHFEDVVVAENAGEAAMLQALRKIVAQKAGALAQ